MSWHKMIIPGDQADAEFRNFVDAMYAGFLRLDARDEFEVWESQTTCGDRVLYLSPIAAECALQLRTWNDRIVPCASPQDLACFRLLSVFRPS